MPFFVRHSDGTDVMRDKAPSLSADQTRYLRLRAQRLVSTAEHQCYSVNETTHVLCGIQAQYHESAKQSIWVRGQDLLAEQISHARVEERSLVRTWCMRGTLHIVTTEDLGWLLALLGPIFVRKSSHRYRALGLAEQTFARAAQAMQRLLGDIGPMTRTALASHLAKQGIPTEGQAIYHLLRRAALEGVVCFGPDQADEPTYVVLENWVSMGDVLNEQEALAQLARRYLTGYGPARAEDLAAWSGLSLRQARRGLQSIESELLRIDLNGSQAWMSKSQEILIDKCLAASRIVRLLPAYDPYLVGYRSRDLIVDPRYAKRVHPGGGVIRPTIIVEGRIVGTWRAVCSRTKMAITVESFKELDDEIWKAIQDEARDLGRFYQKAVTLEHDRVLAP